MKRLNSHYFSSTPEQSLIGISNQKPLGEAKYPTFKSGINLPTYFNVWINPLKIFLL